MREVDVVLATFNGMNYLQEQIASIENQSHGGYTLIIHDDGSSDGTGEYLQTLRLRSSSVRVLDAPPTGGASANFSLLLSASKAPYIFCSDQDDIWLSEKMGELLALMKFYEKVYGENTPLLVHSDVELIDSDGATIARSFWEYQNIDPRWGDQFNLLLTQNTVTGCAMLVNRALLQQALPIPPEAVMHDWWLGLVACAFGKVVWTGKPTVLYRQHGRNEVGAKRFDLSYLLSKLSSLPDRGEAWKSLRATARQAAAFAERFPDAPQAAQARRFADLPRMGAWERRRTMMKDRFYKVGAVRNVAWLGLV